MCYCTEQFGVCESLVECEAAAANGLAGAPPCLSVTWHSPACTGCGSTWDKHCYCAVTDIWLPDIASMKSKCAQTGVDSAKCTSPDGACGGGWDFTWVILLGLGLYLLGVRELGIRYCAPPHILCLSSLARALSRSLCLFTLDPGPC